MLETQDLGGWRPTLDALPIGFGVIIPATELEFHAITGGGPGGQHVNRSATRVVLRWNAERSGAITEEQRALVRRRLAPRLDSDGTLRLVAGEYRSQWQNRRAACERLQGILRRALLVAPQRKPTHPTRRSVEQRLTAKHQRSETKRQRRHMTEE